MPASSATCTRPDGALLIHQSSTKRMALVGLPRSDATQ